VAVAAPVPKISRPPSAAGGGLWQEKWRRQSSPRGAEAAPLGCVCILGGTAVHFTTAHNSRMHRSQSQALLHSRHCAPSEHLSETAPLIPALRPFTIVRALR
jgi:hypothetical protein